MGEHSQDQSQDSLPGADVTYIPSPGTPSVRSRPSGSFYKQGFLIGCGLGVCVVTVGFLDALIVAGFGVLGIIVAHGLRRISQGRLDLTRAWNALFTEDE